MVPLRYFVVLACLVYVVASYDKMFQQFPQHNFGFDMKHAATGGFQSALPSGFGVGHQGFDLKHSASGQGTAQYGQGSWWDGFRKGWEDGMKYVKSGGKSSHTAGLSGGGHSGGQMSLAQFSNQGQLHRM